MQYLENRDTPEGSTGCIIQPRGESIDLVQALATLVGAEAGSRILAHAGEPGIRAWRAEELAATCDVPLHAALTVVAARTLYDGHVTQPATPITSPRDILDHLPPGFAALEVEMVLAIGLDGRNRVRALVLVAQGGGSLAALEPRDVFAPLVRLRVRAFVLVHNHPSGDPTPSEADVILTNRLAAAGQVLALPLVDHVVIGGGRIFSLLEANLLPTAEEISSMTLHEPSPSGNGG
jgi:DNA repair protein RadC